MVKRGFPELQDIQETLSSDETEVPQLIPLPAQYSQAPDNTVKLLVVSLSIIGLIVIAAIIFDSRKCKVEKSEKNAERED